MFILSKGDNDVNHANVKFEFRKVVPHVQCEDFYSSYCIKKRNITIIDHCSVLARDFYSCQCNFFVSITRTVNDLINTRGVQEGAFNRWEAFKREAFILVTYFNELNVTVYSMLSAKDVFVLTESRLRADGLSRN